MELYRHEIAEILSALPNPVPLHQAFDRLLPDLVVCALGFEDRTGTVLQELDSANRLSAARLLVIHYPTNVDDNEAHSGVFAEIAQRMRSRRDITYSRSTFSERLAEELHDVPNGANVIFDLSTASSYLAYPVIKALVSHECELTITYCEAEAYYPTLEEWQDVAHKADAEEGRLFVHSFEDADFLSLGVDDVFPCNLFAERNPGNKPSTLVAIPNFNPARIGAIIQRDRELNKTSDDQIIWLIGDPPGEQNKWRADAVLRSNRPQSGIPENRVKRVSTFDYKEVIRALEDIWSVGRYTSHLSIGTLGSKLQHLGIFFFIYLHPEIGLWLAEPREFKAGRFSKGSAQTWAIPFGNTADLRQTLEQYMKFTWQPL